jgi:gluconolactonase
VFDRSANCLGVVRVPAGTANFTWGEDDLKSLFITATATLYRIRVRVPGRRTQTAAGEPARSA